MTAEELFALPENDRIDRRLIRGRLVERPYPFRCPAHAKVVANLSMLLGNWEHTECGIGWKAYGYGCPYRIQRSPDTLLCYDSGIVTQQIADATSKQAPFVDEMPTLAIEVVDLSDPIDALRELAEVTDFGIPLFWLIDPVQEIVEVHRPLTGSVILERGDDLVADFVGPKYRFPVSALFE